MVKMDDMAFLVLSVVNEIPMGKVASYQQIASLIGYKKNSRLVGHILARASLYGDYPCHRVVNSKGRLVPHWDEQKELLINEGVQFKKNGCVDMNTYQWKIGDEMNE